jgi:Fic family protein
MAALYDSPAQMEPMTIESSRPAYPALVGLAHELAEASARLDAALAPRTALSLSEQVVGMNCYYSNLIEGHRTLPIDIAFALRQMGGQGDQGHLPRLVTAHIAADQWAKSQSLAEPAMLPFLREVHRRFCEKLPPEDLCLSDGTRMTPGEWRQSEVAVGAHLAPVAAMLPAFLARFAEVYGSRLTIAHQRGVARLDALIAAFAAHHRLVWIHPFLDGNGRVARITLDAMLRACGVNNKSLWSMSRGFAKSSDQYKARLAAADSARRGALDGRRNLSEKGLIDFCTYALQTAIDQAHFMAGMFALDHFKFRAEGYFQRVRFDLKPASAYLYLHAFTYGEFERMEAGRLTGLPERSARDVLQKMVAEGLLVSDSPKGRVRVGFPVHALGSVLPNLYPAGDLEV